MLFGKLAEVHGNRTHLGGYQPPTLDLKSRRPTSDLRTSKVHKIAKPLGNVKVIPRSELPHYKCYRV
jgi:hypothetical protein